ncbi:hypothetical protein [Agrobacterium rosae]|uniref:Uncharacterized protein n=1 Tax=Agrobacterium rosae TaxID=1972867 RepID=A0AAW9FQ38_9HYPH|nr:hypothetical protein [Agrobacterium rosae]MDX8305623.1 hypothetical protein [Agrobacterium rosae]
MANIVDEMIKVDVCEVELDGNQSIVGLITKLQAALDMVPSEFRDVATVHFAAYDWEGVFVEYDRPPTEEERAAADAVFADRQKLIQATSASDMEQWIRKLRLRYLSLTRGPGESLTREEAMEMIVNDEEVVSLHPKYSFRTKLITN